MCDDYDDPVWCSICDNFIDYLDSDSSDGYVLCDECIDKGLTIDDIPAD